MCTTFEDSDAKIEKVFLFHVHSQQDIRNIIHQVISRLNLKSGEKVLIKPNLVCPRSEATTDIRVIEEVVKCLLDKGVDVVLGEGSGFEFDTDKVFKILGVEKLAKKYDVPLVNLRRAKTVEVEIGGRVLNKISLPIHVIEAKAILNLPKLKTHRLTKITFAMKNLIGLLPDNERRKAHVFGINQAIVDLNNYLANKNVLTIGDAIKVMVGRGGPAFGRVFQMDTLIVGQDNVAVDRVACDILGIDPTEVKYLKLAQGNLKFSHIEIIGDVRKPQKPVLTANSNFLYKLAYRFVYVIDYFMSPIHKTSFIPQIITRIGTRVEIDTNKCNRCGRCIEVCPVNAITRDYKIDFEKCRYVRCLKCWEICPVDAIKVKGFSKPER